MKKSGIGSLLWSQIVRLFLQETSLLTKEKMDNELSISYISDLKRKVKENGGEHISLLAKRRLTI